MYDVRVQDAAGCSLAIDDHHRILYEDANAISVTIFFASDVPEELSKVIMVDGRKCITPKREMLTVDARPYYRLRFNLKVRPCAPSNTMRLIRFKSTGQFEVTEIGVAQQEQNFFLIQQIVYVGTCYSDNYGRVVIPRFDQPYANRHWGSKHWSAMSTQLKAMLHELQARTPLHLEPISQFQPPPALEIPRADDIGVVLFYNDAMNAGFVMLADGSVAYVPYHSIRPNGALFRRLHNGQRIVFEKRIAVEDRKLPMLEDVRPLC